MIKTEALVKTYQSGKEKLRVLDEVSLRVEKGEFLAILGPSGSGKSTLMHILGCLDLPSQGQYFLDNENVLIHNDEKLAEIRNRKIGFVFQKFNLLPRFTALQNVMIPLLYRGEEDKKARETAVKVLEMVGLENRLHHKPNELSGGQQQRVAIARSLVGDPPLLLADEPTGNLDSKSGQDVMNIFKDLNKIGNTIVLITHDLEVAREARRVAFIRDGKLSEA
ncbi:MAG: ABC transporter ATP-binding protein [Peptococcaceae bacterium]|nr:ABC transporter ATP-binding protein [Peptococcaceae bacterium]